MREQILRPVGSRELPTYIGVILVIFGLYGLYWGHIMGLYLYGVILVVFHSAVGMELGVAPVLHWT